MPKDDKINELLKRVLDIEKTGKDIISNLGDTVKDQVTKLTKEISELGLFPIGEYSKDGKTKNIDYKTSYSLYDKIDAINKIPSNAIKDKLNEWVKKYVNTNIYKGSSLDKDDNESKVEFDGDLLELKVATNSFLRAVFMERKYALKEGCENKFFEYAYDDRAFAEAVKKYEKEKALNDSLLKPDKNDYRFYRIVKTEGENKTYRGILNLIAYLNHYLDSSLTYGKSGNDSSFLIYLYKTLDELFDYADLSETKKKIISLSKKDPLFKNEIDAFEKYKMNYRNYKYISHLIETEKFALSREYIKRLVKRGNETVEPLLKNFHKSIFTGKVKYKGKYKICFKKNTGDIDKINIDTQYEVEIL